MDSQLHRTASLAAATLDIRHEAQPSLQYAQTIAARVLESAPAAKNRSAESTL